MKTQRLTTAHSQSEDCYRIVRKVGLKMNASKTKAMVGHSANLGQRLSTPAYKRKLDGGGESHSAAKRRKVSCPVCDAELQAASLARHIHRKHGSPFRPAKRRRLLEEAERPPRTYETYSPKYVWPLGCPVEGCPGRAQNRYALRMHFAYRHPRDSVCIIPEGLLPHCPDCNLQCHHTRRHSESMTCQKGKVRKRRREQELQTIRDLEATFQVGNSIVDNVDEFVYLGRVVTANDTDWPAVSRNLVKARKRWARFSALLKREGASPKVSGLFYKAVVMSQLLYACETWVINESIMKALAGFHHRIARGITRDLPRYYPDQDQWFYPPIAPVLQKAGLHDMEHYIERRRRYICEYVRGRPSLQRCLDLEGRSSSPGRIYWWRQNGVTV